MGEQSDRSATWKQVVWLLWSLPRNKRTVAARRSPLASAMANGALTRRATREDTQQSVERVSALAADCIILWGGFCVCETHCGGGYSASERHGYRRRLHAARNPRFDARLFGGGHERFIGEYMVRHISTEAVAESMYVVLCISPRRAEAGQRERRHRYGKEIPMCNQRKSKKAALRRL